MPEDAIVIHSGYNIAALQKFKTIISKSTFSMPNSKAIPVLSMFPGHCTVINMTKSIIPEANITESILFTIKVFGIRDTKT